MKYILISILLLSANYLFAQSPVEKVVETVNKSEIKAHIYFLASDELKGRDTGSPGIEKAAEYLVDELKSYGVKPVPGADGDGYYQYINFRKTQPAQSGELQIGNQSFQLNNDFAIVKGRNIETSGSIIDLDYGLEEDFKRHDLEGKFVLLRAGTPEDSSNSGFYQHMNEKIARAREAGVKGVFEYYDFPESYWENVVRFFNRETFELAGNDQDSLIYLWLRTENPADNSFELTIEGMQNEIIQDKNVVGRLEGTDPELKDEFVIYSAHYDHVGIGQPDAENDSIFNGARDNAVGVVTVLSTAKNVALYPTRRSSLFVLFTAEEKGLYGSSYYANNPLIPHKQVVYLFNSDGGGYNDTTVSTIIGLDRTTARNLFEEANQAFGLEAIDDPTPGKNFFNRSDNVHFARVGIPAPTYSMGFTAFDAEIEKYYHQRNDEADTMDYDYLLKFFRSYVLSARLIANTDQELFWVEGDPYYEAGEKLYGR